MIKVKYENKIVSLLCSPIQPLNIPETKEKVVEKVDIKFALKFAASLSIIITSQTVVAETVREISGKLGNFNVSIPVFNTTRIEGVPESIQGVSYSDNTVSMLENYNQGKKFARYIIEYMFWLYSGYINDNHPGDISIETMAE